MDSGYVLSILKQENFFEFSKKSQKIKNGEIAGYLKSQKTFQKHDNYDLNSIVSNIVRFKIDYALYSKDEKINFFISFQRYR